MQGKSIRRSAIAGTWYPGRASTLTRTVQDYLAQVPARQEKGELLGLIVPHAGYQYSGQVAAHAYKELEDKAFELIYLLGPSHRAWVGEVVTNEEDCYQTPLGLVELERRALDALASHIHLNQVRGDMEHSLEIQLPFLQVVLGEFRLVPIIMGGQSLTTCQALASALVATLRKHPGLMVASSDLSHFHPYDRARSLDELVVSAVRKLDPEGLLKDLASGRCEACGGGPIATVLMAARDLGASRVEILNYANSGDVTGDRSSVVGYLAAAIYA